MVQRVQGLDADRSHDEQSKRIVWGQVDGPSRKPHKQRCAIRVTYSPNQVRGQWAAHGRYIARESANSAGVGFSSTGDDVALSATLGEWQNAGDPRMFKMIVSPEFGERLDLKKHTRELMTRLAQELGTELHWVSVAHFNTGHPHVHVALRGVTALGNLRLPRDVIKHSIRAMPKIFALSNWDSALLATPLNPNGAKSALST